jgi:hypothetical protein
MAFADEWHYSGVERIVAVGDVHGAYEALVETLQAAGVVDDELAWSGAGTHLVFTGDLLDRGPESRRVMDLIMRLEKESARAGGRVHLLLGNHEVMNLVGDLRYVSNAEYAAFSTDESAKERKRWYRVFRRNQSPEADEAAIRSEFDRKAPPGFFGHRRAFRSDGTYGGWLLGKPLLIVVNDTAFVHGGVPRYVAERGLDGVNGSLKKDMRDYMAAVSAFEDAGILNPVERYRERPSILAVKAEAGQLDGAWISSAQLVAGFRNSPLQGPAGPTWYRGTALCNRLFEGDGLTAALNRIGAKRVAMGHTTTGSRRVQQRMDGRVLEIDTGMLKSSYQGSGNALIIEDGMVSVVNQDGSKNLLPVAHPQRVGGESETFDDDALTGILLNGAIVGPISQGTGWQLVQVVAGDESVFAYFSEPPRENGFLPELAAYRLDRMLGLYMVPVTVLREIKGRQGTLQFVPGAAISERARVTEGKGDHAYCSLDKQMGAMRVFDALINQPARAPLSMLYSQDDWQLMLVNHENSFSIANGRQDYHENVVPAVGGQWRSALLELDDEKLRRNLGDVLDANRLEALARRRDGLIESAGR